jgi:hypothetical protein
MFESLAQSPQFALIETIAETIREELGDEVEACPGLASPEQGEPLNRLFRALVRHLLEPVIEHDDDQSRLTSWVLRELARRRLAAGGLTESQIKTLLELEPGTPDDWLTFLILVPWTEVLYWLTAADQEPA